MPSSRTTSFNVAQPSPLFPTCPDPSQRRLTKTITSSVSSPTTHPPWNKHPSIFACLPPTHPAASPPMTMSPSPAMPASDAPPPAARQSPVAQADTSDDRPVPREPRSAMQTTRVRIQNRRREYLSRHPEYFDADHELADPVLYERLIKRHQSAAEREAEGRAKGYGRTLEADLVRGETKLSDLRAQADANNAAGENGASRLVFGKTSTGVDEAWDQPAETKDQGLELWRLFLTRRFVEGRDEDFEYSTVDESEEYDGMARREEEERWFEEEEPTQAGEGELHGETGIQDF